MEKHKFPLHVPGLMCSSLTFPYSIFPSRMQSQPVVPENVSVNLLVHEFTTLDTSLSPTLHPIKILEQMENL